MDIAGFLQKVPAIGGLFKGKDGGATSSEFTGLAGLYAAVSVIDCPGWIKVVTLGAATVVYGYLRMKIKTHEAA